MTTPVAPTVSWTGVGTDAATTATTLLSDNKLYLFAMPIAWVGYKVVRRVISKIG